MGEVGVAFLSFVLGGKGNLSGKDCVEQEALVVRELFLSLNERGCSSQTRGFNYDSPDYHSALPHCSSAG